MEATLQQDMDLIDILWKQDIDLGARREVFDYNHRQKEHELRRQRELEEEKRLHLLQEQEKAFLAQLQLDEETGEYIPLPPPSAPLQSVVAPADITQDGPFTAATSEGLSFDECLKLLEETFPVEETESDLVPPSGSMMTPEPPALLPASVTSAQLTQPQRVGPDLDQAWMELLSLPELQHCLNMQMQETLENSTYPLQSTTTYPLQSTTTYPLQNSTTYPLQNTEAPSKNYPNYLQVQAPIFNQMTNITDVKADGSNAPPPPEFADAFVGSVPTMAPSDFTELNLAAPQINANFTKERFDGLFFPGIEQKDGSNQRGHEGSESMSEAPSGAGFSPKELYSLSERDPSESGKRNPAAEHLDSDSGISTNGSPNARSPGKYAYESGAFGSSDSEMDDMDQNPGSAESDYSEMFSLNFQPDRHESAIAISIPSGAPPQQEKMPKQPRVDPAEDGGHSAAPFSKDKPKKRSDARLSRDEQRAKTLKIPFTVDMIINLPVDDFNEMMSKHQLNEAQLALVRDIRRRGKNKVAAQNCRKRKMENIVGLESELDSLKEERDRLLSQKGTNATDLKAMKRELNRLYQQVFSMLRDDEGKAYSMSDYSLQQSAEGTIFLVPRMKKTFKSEDCRLSSL